MKLVIPGGTGQVGTVLDRALTAAGHEVVILTRRPERERELPWDGRTLGPWAEAIDGADAVINLAGRSVNCRYTPANLREMMHSRVESARVVGEAVAAAARPPRVWLQMSTATVYAHRFDAPNDEATGVIGGGEPGVPRYWSYSVRIAEAWERAQAEATTPSTRKVALRAAMVMSPDRGGVFDVLLRMARLGLGGPVAGGAQYVSWIHEADFCRAVDFLITGTELEGVVNVAAPGPVTNAELMRRVRAEQGRRFGLPAARWMLEVGARVLRTETELVLKSRRVVPGRLLASGFAFDYPTWPAAAAELCARWRAAR